MSHGVGEAYNETIGAGMTGRGCSGSACHNDKWHGVVRSGRLGVLVCMLVDNKSHSNQIKSNQIATLHVCVPFVANESCQVPSACISL